MELNLVLLGEAHLLHVHGVHLGVHEGVQREDRLKVPHEVLPGGHGVEEVHPDKQDEVGIHLGEEDALDNFHRHIQDVVACIQVQEVPREVPQGGHCEVHLEVPQEVPQGPHSNLPVVDEGGVQKLVGVEKKAGCSAAGEVQAETHVVAGPLHSGEG